MASKPTANELQSYQIDSMVQGITQQSAWVRRDTQAEGQFDCVNSPLNGCEARPGFDFVSRLGDASDRTNAFCYEIFRGDSEHYLVVIDATARTDGHRLHAYDLNTGNQCTVNYLASEGYLACTKPASESLFASTVDDTTFIGNRAVVTKMSTTLLAPTALNQGIVYFKAGGYLITFQVAVTIPTFSPDPGNISGKVYTWTYVTPDNSTTANAAYISTNQMAATFFRSFTGVDAVVTATGTTVAGVGFTAAISAPAGPAVVTAASHGLVVDQPFSFETTGVLPGPVLEGETYYVIAAGLTSGAFQFSTTRGGSPVATTNSPAQSGVHTVLPGYVPGTVTGVGPASTGVVGSGGLGGLWGIGGGVSGAKLTGSTTLTSLGFTVKLNANVILISRADNVAFSIDTGDGVGDTYLHCCKDTIQNFDDLPASCFSGFTVKVIGSNQNVDDDYFVQFVGADGSNGYWEEVVAPGTPLTFDDTTMPLILVNTNTNTFDFKVPPWGSRVAGDGIFTALDPSFIGRPIQDISFDHGRLALLSEGSCVWSRAKSPYVFFRDSAQTVLDTDPIDALPGGGTTIALMRKVVQIAESTFLWAEKIQFRANSGTEPFTAANIQLPPSTNYEFAPLAVPKPIGTSLYFVTETGNWATIRDLSLQNGLPVGAVDATGHVKKLIPSGVRWLTASDTLGYLFCSTVGAANMLFCYNYLLSATARLQSSWNPWRLPASSAVLWMGMDLNYLFALVQRPDGAMLLRADLSVDLVDSDTGATYLSRLDFRVTEAQCTLAYDATANQTTIALPFGVTEVVGWMPANGPCPLIAINRDSSGTRKRGHQWNILSLPDATHCVVSGDIRGDHWYIGWRIRSERTQSRMYLKTTKGLVPADQITIKEFRVNFSASAYFRAEVLRVGATQVENTEMTAQRGGDNLYQLGTVPIVDGTIAVPIDTQTDQFSLTLVNDSPFPSKWLSCSFSFTTTYRARPSEFGQSIPSYFAQGGSAGSANNF